MKTTNATDMSSHRSVEHQIEVDAPAAEAYRLIADVRNWPNLFPPTVHVDVVERTDHDERIRIWATANGQVKNWTSHRTLDPDRLTIDFRQEVSAAPVAAMGGTWLIEPTATGTRVRLLHDFRAVRDDPGDLAWIERAVDRNSRSELAALKAGVERLTTAGAERMFSFADTVRVHGAAEDVYDFIYEAQLWEQRLPHVSRVVLTEDVPGLQTLEMDTRAKDGSSHTTVSTRVCFPHSMIVYKQITLPALLALHTGRWTVAEGSDGGPLTVTSEHTVAINEAAITTVLGAGAGLQQARDFVRTALSANSLATLGHARDYAEISR